jgi:hypothetical protein
VLSVWRPPWLQVIVQKLSETEGYKAAVLQYADEIMNTLLQVFSSRSTTVHEEAMLAVGAFTYACGRQFNKYLPAFYPFLKMGLMNHQEWQVRSCVWCTCVPVFDPWCLVSVQAAKLSACRLLSKGARKCASVHASSPVGLRRVDHSVSVP